MLTLLIQCAIPVFDGLLPEPHNTRILKLLFDLAHWHGLAKLRMHTDRSMEILSLATAALGESLRDFREKTCSIFQTRELERERTARQRRQRKAAVDTLSEEKSVPPSSNARNRKPKELNLKTYKFHALGDYVSIIQRFGTTDSYTTQPVSFQLIAHILLLTFLQSELEHRRSKTRFLRTSGRLIPQQLAKIERRQRRIRMIREKLQLLNSQGEVEDVADSPQAQYSMGLSQKWPVHVPTFLKKNEGDPAIQVRSFMLSSLPSPNVMQNFYSKLKGHLLPRIREMLQQEAATLPEPSGLRMASDDRLPPPTDEDSKFVFLKKDTIYHHRLSRFHFTTYDVRRGTDIINPGTARCNIMLLSDTTDLHHFLYARVIGAYHANVIYTGTGMRDYEARRMDFLWVRWYEVVDPASSGWGSSKLDSLRFLPINRPNAFGFVDPKDVLRGSHILPNFNFAKGKRHADGKGVSCCAKDGKDYHRYYVGR
jgi:hypothetical protein